MRVGWERLFCELHLTPAPVFSAQSITIKRTPLPSSICWGVMCLCLGIAIADAQVAPSRTTESSAVADTGCDIGSQGADAIAQLRSNTEYLPAWYDMFARVPGDWGAFASDNFKIERIPAVAGLAGLTAALVLSDQVTWKATNDFSNRNGTTRDITQAFSLLGDGRTVLGLAGGFAIAGWTTSDKRALQTASQLVESYLSTGVSVQLLKHISGRERPERQTSPRGIWRPFPNQSLYQHSIPKFDSFPSGHTASAMAMVTVLIENYPEEHWLRPVGYGVVGLVGFGLVSKGWHWYSDLPLAIAMGYQFGKIAAHPNGVNTTNSEHADAVSQSHTPALSVMPSVGIDGAGVKLAFSF